MIRVDMVAIFGVISDRESVRREAGRRLRRRGASPEGVAA